MDNYIEVKGARVNNLKNVSLNIPRNKFITITGVSGSGKSSLAFDTLYAEGQRRYVESLSAYARQFLGRMSKPECDFIKGLPPAIAIEQKVISRNPRSTVGTSTEIYEYMRLLFARIGHTYSPISGEEVKRHTPEDVIHCIMGFSKGTKFMMLSPLHVVEGRTLKKQLEMYMQEGYSRLYKGGEVLRIEDLLNEDNISDTDASSLFLIIARMSVDDSKDAISRMTDSAETAFYEGDGLLKLVFLPGNITYEFSTRFEADGIKFEEPNDNMFSFNSPLGACPTCEGFGSIIGIDEKLVIPNSSLSVYDGCVQCWHGDKMGNWRSEFIRRAATDNFPIFEPYYKFDRVLFPIGFWSTNSTCFIAVQSPSSAVYSPGASATSSKCRFKAGYKMPLIRLDFPEPDTPVTQLNTLSGNFTSMPRRLFIRAPFSSMALFHLRLDLGVSITSRPVKYLMV